MLREVASLGECTALGVKAVAMVAVRARTAAIFILDWVW